MVISLPATADKAPEAPARAEYFRPVLEEKRSRFWNGIFC